MTIDFSNIILWRHAEAEQADIELSENNIEIADMARILTARGQRQAKRVARWLINYLPKETLILCSPALRCTQTAELLKRKIMTSQAFEPNANLHEILNVLANLQSPRPYLLLVGHQPWLGQLVTHLTGFSGAELNIKKGAIWWLRQSLMQTSLNHPQYDVISVQAPSLLPK